MSDDIQAVEVPVAATPENVATPDTGTEPVKEVSTQAEDTKSFSQAELDKIIQKEKAKAEARAERRALKVYAEKLEVMSRQNQPPAQPAADGKPTMAQFANVEDYVEAVADWKLEQREQNTQQERAKEQQKTTYDKTEGLYAEAQKIQGFDREVFDDLPLTPVIAQTIIDSDMAPQLMAHLTMNPDIAEKIANLSPARQAAEIGKLEATLLTAKPVQVSKAPEPIKPIGNRGSTTKDPSDMSPSEFAKWRRAQISSRGNG